MTKFIACELCGEEFNSSHASKFCSEECEWYADEWERYWEREANTTDWSRKDLRKISRHYREIFEPKQGERVMARSDRNRKEGRAWAESRLFGTVACVCAHFTCTKAERKQLEAGLLKVIGDDPNCPLGYREGADPDYMKAWLSGVVEVFEERMGKIKIVRRRA